MRHTTRIELANLSDLNLASRGIIAPEEVRRVIVEDALVDTGATRLCLPKPIIEQLGLSPFGNARARTAAGIVNRTIYSEVRFTILEREGSLPITDLPADAPVLVGHMVLEQLDLYLDIRKGLIYNPDHGDDWIEDAW